MPLIAPTLPFRDMRSLHAEESFCKAKNDVKMFFAIPYFFKVLNKQSNEIVIILFSKLHWSGDSEGTYRTFGL